MESGNHGLEKRVHVTHLLSPLSLCFLASFSSGSFSGGGGKSCCWTRWPFKCSYCPWSCRRALLETISTRARDRLYVALGAKLKKMQERMANRHIYEAFRMAYVLSGLSSHSWQRSTTTKPMNYEENGSVWCVLLTLDVISSVAKSSDLGPANSQDYMN